ncbi:hAT family dimerization domain protein [Metarhizium robertsii]|uniref:HAT family dimerization domain protein n=1 Tax=Metarhizium robertsii TaxID=568076 RepID=A0A014N4H6_9HYPO|nr:hAT family dimerization domain protein [Metarhizium robertsii]
MAAQQQSIEPLLGIAIQRKSLKQQLDSASINVEIGRTALADLPTVHIGCKRYIPEEYIANKNRKGRRSWIQAHGFFLTEVSPDLRTLQTYWVCAKCDEHGKSSLFVASNTTSPIEHLRRSHLITQTDHSLGNAEDDSACADIYPPSKRRCVELPTARCNVNKAKELTVGWIVSANLPFTAPSNPYLRRILDLHDASLAKEVPWSRQSVRDTMRKLFEVKKGAISIQLEKAVTRISFSFDMWTSPNRYALLGLHAHYLDASYRLQSRLLALRRVWGSHSGDNQATTIYGVFGEYGIRDRIGAGVCDNASSNDTCLVSLFRQLSPPMTEEDIRNHRTRCFGHIINLAARAFLWGEDADSFEREAFTEAAFQVEERELRLWRKRGAVGKLHNIVRFIRASPQRRELMKSLACNQRDDNDYQLFDEERAAIDLELMQNNETRWNSTYLMIQRAIRKREQIDHFITYLETKAGDPRQRVPVQDHLSPQDWLLLTEIQSLLKPLYEVTMRCQGWAKEGRYGALWEVMIGMEYLLNFFEEQKLIFSPPDATTDVPRHARSSAATRCSGLQADQSHGREKHLPQHTRGEYTTTFSQADSFDTDHRRCIQISINNCWSKLDEYYTLLGQSPLYPAAVILHPRWNVSWLEANWTSREQLVWLRDAKKSVREYFELHYPANEPSDRVKTVIGKAMRQTEPSQFDQWMQSQDRHMMEEDDELAAYMRQGPIRRENLNPILWWKDHQEEYPRLSKFALDILAIPAMSADPERTFSVTKLTCLRNWLGHQAITVGEVVSFGEGIGLDEEEAW